MIGDLAQGDLPYKLRPAVGLGIAFATTSKSLGHRGSRCGRPMDPSVRTCPSSDPSARGAQSELPCSTAPAATAASMATIAIAWWQMRRQLSASTSRGPASRLFRIQSASRTLE